MKNTGFVFFFLLLWCSSVLAASAPVPASPQIDARGYILIDYNSGVVLTEKNADEQMQPASLTKLMTAYVVFHELQEGRIHLNDMATVSEKAWHTGGSRMFVKVGTQVSVEDLLTGMLVPSGNDAATTLAEYVGGSEDAFVSLMNDYARKLGMTHTHFLDATGLPNPDHLTTPRDLSRLAVGLIREFPQYYHFFSIKKFAYNNISQDNYNTLLFRDPSVDGLKTGHTDLAGFCLVASANRNNMRLISVVMGTNSESARTNQSETLLNYGFHFFETHELYAANTSIKTTRVWKGSSKQLDIGLTTPLWVTVPQGDYGKLSENMTVVPSVLMAPVQKGATVGSLKVELGDKVVTERPLVALESIAQGGLVQRVTDDVLMMWHKYR